MSHELRDDRACCRRHQPFYDEECSWCVQADIHFKRQKLHENKPRIQRKALRPNPLTAIDLDHI